MHILSAFDHVLRRLHVTLKHIAAVDRVLGAQD